VIKLTETIWIGNSADERSAGLCDMGIKNVLNVAHDLDGTRGLTDGVEYAQVGLIDGPGNPLSAYYAAVLTLNTLQERGPTLVVCHDGCRALTVAIMYLNTKNGTADIAWGRWLRLLSERVETVLPNPNNAHQEAFQSMKWKTLASITK
jgi:hypothetical protein